MPSFTYRARDMGGNLVAGVLEAEHPAAVIDRLRQRQLFVVEVRPQAVSRTAMPLPAFTGRISSRDLAVFCRQLATMVNSGLTLLHALSILERQSENRRLARTVGEVRRAVEQGSSFYEALGRFPEVFPAVFTNMVEAGELGGVLDDILQRLATYFEKEHDLNEKIRSATTYPAAVSVIAVGAVIFMLTFILPSFTSMLTGMGAPLPLPTKLVMALSHLLSSFWYLWVGGLVAVVLGFWRYLGTEGGKEWWDRTILRVPVGGLLVKKVAISRFAFTWGILIGGGVPILQALEVVKKAAGNRVITHGLEQAQANIRQGQGMAGPLAETGVFPPMVTEMVAVGEETGALDLMLERISDFYDREVDAAVSRLSSMIEPVLIVGLGGVVGFLVLSMMLPIFSLYGAVQ